MPETTPSGNAPSPAKGDMNPDKLKKLDTDEKSSGVLDKDLRAEKKS